MPDETEPLLRSDSSEAENRPRYGASTSHNEDNENGVSNADSETPEVTKTSFLSLVSLSFVLGQ